jgi:hypothetical protein
MSTDAGLIEKREELKHQLAAGDYKTLIDVLFALTDRLIRKITGRTRLFPTWFIAVILLLTIVLIIFLILYVTDDYPDVHNLMDTLGLDYELGLLLMLISPAAMNILGLVLINQYIGRIFILWRDDVIDATESLVSLDDFKEWLEKVCNRPRHLVITIVLGLLSSLYLIVINSKILGRFVGYGITFGSLLLYVVGFTFFYLFFMAIHLSVRLRRYDLKLFAADPASSELLSRLSGVLGLFIYFVSIYATYLTLVTAFIGLLSVVGIPAILILWGPTIAMFILNQLSLASMIRRAKWRTLNEIQAKVEALQAASNFADKETMDAINRLMDFHDRVKRTRNSAIDLGATLNFINSLLLPLLAFLIGNFGFVVSLFKKHP